MNWQRTARWIVAALGLGCAAAIAWYGRSRPVPATPPVELAKVDPASALEAGEGHTTIYRADRSPVKLAFKSTRRYTDGRSQFQDVQIEGLEGSRYVVRAGLLETGGPAPGSERPSQLALSGAVTLVTDDGLELRSKTALWKDATGELTMPGEVTFTKGRVSGRGNGAIYDRALDAFTILQRASAHAAPDADGKGGADATSNTMTLVRGQNALQLEGNARIVGSTQTLTSRAATLSFGDAGQAMKYLELRGAARAVPRAGGPADLPAMNADSITMSFYEDGQTLQHATLTGMAALDLGGSAPRSVRGSWIDVFTAKDGRTVTRLQARDRVKVTLAPTATSAGRTITASVLLASGDDVKGLTSARFEGNPRFEEQPGASAGRGAGPAAGVARAGEATILVLTLGGDLSAIERAEFQQNARFQSGGMTAQADVAQYQEASGLLRLIPNAREPRRLSRVTTADMTVDGATIDVDTATNDLRAQGTVTTRLTHAPGADTRGALFAGDEPIIGGADSLRFTNSTGTARYAGSARAPARLKQGESEVVADQIEFADRSRNLSARGRVDSAWLLESPGSKPGEIVVKKYAVRAETLQYDEAARTATYTGPTVTMTTSDSEVEAGTLTFRLAAESRTLEAMRAQRAVWTRMSGGYEAVGDTLLYETATELYTLEGRAGQETAQVKSPRSDTQGSKTPMCNVNDGMKLELDRRTGAVRIPGSGQAPRNVTEVSCSTSLRRAK